MEVRAPLRHQVDRAPVFRGRDAESLGGVGPGARAFVRWTAFDRLSAAMEQSRSMMRWWLCASNCLVGGPSIHCCRDPADGEGPLERDEQPLSTLDLGTTDPRLTAKTLITCARHHRTTL